MGASRRPRAPKETFNRRNHKFHFAVLKSPFPLPLDTGGFGVLAAVVRELVRTLKCIIRTKSKEHELHDGALGDPWSSLLSSNDENQHTVRAWHPNKVCEVCSLDLNSAIPTLDISIISQK